ncbi:MAG: Wzz/FepE/Etk N-terminal domain-containing protein [Marinifilaceae bacterium]|jgi:uncharacterized protein involved in exopolysaccharide biosynthesis|nr:Wzz/FepE/Etk N-terminal domain-containing protein [Marinifilaceae bacterium]
MQNNITKEKTELVEEEEINIIELILKIWNKRKVIYISLIITVSLGILTAIFSPVEYTADLSFIPNINSSKSGLASKYGSLASMAGIDLSSFAESTGSGVPPQVYPQILESVTFRKSLIHKKLYFEKYKKKISLIDYYSNYHKPSVLSYIKKYSIGIFGTILSAIKSKKSEEDDKKNNSGHIFLSQTEYKLLKNLKDKFSLEVNSKQGDILIKTFMPDPIAAAELAEAIRIQLQTEITKIKIEKAENKLEYINDRYTEKKHEFEIIQNKLSSYLDKHKHVSKAYNQQEIKNIKSEYDLIYKIYSSLSSQLEAQKLQVKEDTPVFTIIKPVSIPKEKSKPQRSTIIMLSVFIGLVFGIGYILMLMFWNKIREVIAEKRELNN